MDPGVVRTSPPPAVAAGEESRDARVVREILRSVGLGEGDYDEGVVYQLLILAYRYAGDVLGEAKVYADHAGRESLEADDVRLAIQAKAMFSSEPPRREVILDMARSWNEIPLPKSNPPLDQSLFALSGHDVEAKLLTGSSSEANIDQVEETKDDDEGSNPRLASPNFGNKQEHDASNKRPSKRVSSQLNAMVS